MWTQPVVERQLIRPFLTSDAIAIVEQRAATFGIEWPDEVPTEILRWPSADGSVVYVFERQMLNYRVKGYTEPMSYREYW